MPKFLIDEDMPRATARILRSRGHEVIAHFPNEVSANEMNRRLDTALLLLSEKDLRGNLVIIEPGRLRIRRR